MGFKKAWLREDFKKKKSKISDIGKIGSPTYPTLPNSDMKFSDIFFPKPRPTLPYVLVT